MTKSKKGDGVAADTPAETDVDQAAAAVEPAEARKRRALAALKALSWPLPPGYRFDRDEANSR